MSKFTSQLSNLLKKGTQWRWEKEHKAAFEEVKRLFLEDIIIRYPDFNQCFYLCASCTYIGAELFQLVSEQIFYFVLLQIYVKKYKERYFFFYGDTGPRNVAGGCSIE